MKIEKICFSYINGYPDQALLHIDAPIGWWYDFSSYNIGEIKNHQSIHLAVIKKPFSWDDFDSQALVNYGGSAGGENGPDYRYAHGLLMCTIIESLNAARDRYLKFNTKESGQEHMADLALEQIIGLLPQSYIIGRDLELSSDDISAILSLPKEGHHLCDLQNFLSPILKKNLTII